MTQDRWTEVSRQLTGLEHRRDFSGIALVAEGDRILLESCHGPADRGSLAPVTPSTRFGLASMCKMFTALGVLDAVRRGEVALDSRVVDLLSAARRPVTLAGDVTVHRSSGRSSRR